MKRTLFGLSLAIAWMGCTDVEEDDHHHDDVHGLVTRISLVFAPQQGGDSLTFEWSDPEGDGSPEIDAIELSDTDDYDLSIEVWNDLEDPAENVTNEIAEDADSHQFFFIGSAVEGPATGTNDDAILTHAYADADDNDLPIGLDNTIATIGTGSGELTVVLRHLPPENNTAVKVEGLAETVASDGFSAIGGETDAEVSFDVTVE